jgi:hypothetical protein
MKQLITLTTFLLLLNFSYAQHQVERCRSGSMAKQAIQNNPEIAQKRQAVQAAIQEWIQKNPASPRMEINLPIVVHVLYFDESENISDEQIHSQIEVLNQDFNALNTNYDETPAPFQALRANVGIKFCLASKDPDGNSTTGITRKKVDIREIGETNAFYSEEEGTAAWDVNKYINIWLAAQGEGSLGFASLPGTADPPESDGIVIPSQYFGTIGTVQDFAPNHLGRTATHEMGHYLGLEHIWGNGQSGCDIDDNIEDTPLQFTESSECNTFPKFDQCTENGNGIMYMNYMDYSDDACMTMFSIGQGNVMKGVVMGGPRSSLLESGMTNCESTTTSTKNIISNQLSIYPNPTNDFIRLELEDGNALINAKLEIIDITGRTHIVQPQINNKVINVSSLSNGVYILKIISDNKIYSNKLMIRNHK